MDVETAIEHILHEFSQLHKNNDIMAMYNKIREEQVGETWTTVSSLTKWIQQLRSCTQLLNNDIRICLAFA